MSTYRPLPTFLTIRESELDGLGLFAKEDIPEDTTLGLTHIANPRYEDGWIRTPLGGFFNHSNTPNTRVDEDGDEIYLVTIRDIKAGEEITCFYTLYIPK